MLRPQDAVPVKKGLRFHNCTLACVLVFQSGVSARWALAPRCEIHSMRKCPPPLRKAIGVPETSDCEDNLELTGRMRDSNVSREPWRRYSMPKLSKCWHYAYPVGRTEETTSSREKADTRHMADLARAGHILMLRFGL
jgi:hypothetical protein